MKTYLTLALSLTLGLFLTACTPKEEKNADLEGGFKDSKVLRVGATPVPAAEILEFIKPQLEEKGISLIVQQFTDYVVINTSLEEHSTDANLYQHKPYMDATNAQKGFHLVAIAPIYVVPLGLYSHKIQNIDSLRKGATIAIPGDASNLARALILLHNHGLIKLKDPTNLASTELDIIENPKKLTLKPMEAATLPQVLDSVDAAVINANYALQAQMSLSSSLFHEDTQSAYANVLAAREDNQSDERIQALKDALLSAETREFILKKYKGEVIPL